MRRHYYAALYFSASSLTATAGMAQPTTTDAIVERQYSLPSQPLAETIRAIARSSGTNILAAGRTVEGKQAPALEGRYSVKAALGMVLQGSGLRLRATPAGLLVEPATEAEQRRTLAERFLSQTNAQNARDPELRRAQNLVAQEISIARAKYPDDPVKASKAVDAKRQQVASRLASSAKITAMQVRKHQAQRVREVTQEHVPKRVGPSR